MATLCIATHKQSGWHCVTFRYYRLHNAQEPVQVEKNYFSEIKGDVGMSPHEEGEQEDAYTKTESPCPILMRSSGLCVCCLSPLILAPQAPNWLMSKTNGSSSTSTQKLMWRLMLFGIEKLASLRA